MSPDPDVLRPFDFKSALSIILARLGNFVVQNQCFDYFLARQSIIVILLALKGLDSDAK
eukprot:SAG31_NODE_2041_length_6590_cov_2.334155_2_plen_59_part_00